MDDTISRQAAIDAIDKLMVSIPTAGGKDLMDDVNRIRAEDISVIKRLPSAQPERKRGHWVGIDDEPCETWECDKCGCIQECFDGEQPNYCPNCGADMREDEQE